jgi:hypothetical protein
MLRKWGIPVKLRFPAEGDVLRSGGGRGREWVFSVSRAPARDREPSKRVLCGSGPSERAPGLGACAVMPGASERVPPSKNRLRVCYGRVWVVLGGKRRPYDAIAGIIFLRWCSCMPLVRSAQDTRCLRQMAGSCGVLLGSASGAFGAAQGFRGPGACPRFRRSSERVRCVPGRFGACAASISYIAI